MSRYYVQRTKASWVGDDVWPLDALGHIPSVSDHEPIFTGILDISGDAIMRAPNPMGFGRDDEW